MKPRTRLSIACVATGVTFLGISALGAFSAGAEDSLGSGFVTLSMSGAAAPLRVDGDGFAGQPHGGVYGGVGYAEATLTLNTSHALASTAWPGGLVGNVGSLLLLLGNPVCAGALPVAWPFPPPIPRPPALPPCPAGVPRNMPQETRYLNSPVRAEAQEAGPQNVNNSVPGVTMTASAKSTRAFADSIVGGAQSVDLVSFATARGFADVELTGSNQSVAAAYAHLSDVKIAGGVVTIGSVASFAHATTDAVKATGDGRTYIANLVVGGVPASVDETGVHAASQNQSLAAAQNQINTALRQSGVQMYLAQPTKTVKAGRATYDSGALIVTWKPAANRGPVILALGGSNATAAADPAFVYSLDFPVAGIDPPEFVNPPLIDTAPPPAPFVEPAVPAAPAVPPAVAFTPAANPIELPEGTKSVWVVLGLIGALLVGSGLRGVPGAVVAAVAATCPLGEEP